MTRSFQASCPQGLSAPNGCLPTSERSGLLGGNVDCNRSRRAASRPNIFKLVMSSMNTNHQYSPERIADRMAITDTIYRWCRAIDRLDMDGVRAVFHPDATDDHTAFKGGVDGLIEWISTRHQGIPFSMHQVSNILIEFASTDVALVETCVWCIQRYPVESLASLTQLTGARDRAPSNGIDSMSCSRYVDRFERRQDEWRIAQRTVVIGWKSLFDVPADTPRFPSAWIQDMRNQEDFIFQQRRELGISK